jgi:protein Hikeshi
MCAFAVCFIGKTCAIPSSAFTQVDPTHWLLDVTATISPQHDQLTEVSLFLTGPNVLPHDVALCLYVSLGGTEWAFRGHVSNAHPSEVLPLHWPDPPDVGVPASPGWAKLGISLEPLAEASAKDDAKLGAKQDFARRIGIDLFNYLQSFPGVPPDLRNALDKWFERINRKFRLDPDFLQRQAVV